MRASAYAQDRYFDNVLTIIGPDGRRYPVRRFGYESHARLYDVDIIAGALAEFRVNCRAVLAPEPAHLAVLEHFGLSVDRDAPQGGTK